MIEQLLQHRQMVFLTMSCGLLHGMYSAWGATLPILLKPLGFTTTKANNSAFVGTVAYVIASYAIGVLADSLFVRQLKKLLVCNIVLGMGIFMIFSLSVPFGSMNTIPLSMPDWLQTICLGFVGFFFGCTAPLYFELAAEITYPTEEGFSGNLAMLMINIGNIISLAIFPLLNDSMPAAVNPSLFGIYLVSLLLVAFLVTERYLRSDAKDAKDRAADAHSVALADDDEDTWLATGPPSYLEDPTTKND